MDYQNHQTALLKFASLANQHHLRWCLLGSYNLYLQGIKNNPKDIDITMLLEDKEKINKIFKKYIIEDFKNVSHRLKREAYELILKINGVEIQVIAEPKTGLYSNILITNNLVIKKINNTKIYCNPLEKEMQNYHLTGRGDKANLIAKFLN